jgi:ABC-2 type transport system ATP-binding protein
VPTIELSRVTKRYGDRDVLRGVELALPDGTATTVEGANGSGKSTLLRIVAGVASPTAGTVAGLPRRIAYLPERFSPPPLMRADAYLCHLGRIGGLTTADARRRSEQLLEVLAISPDPRQRLGRLSKGNLQKVGIAQAFASGHALVVLDEPRTGLESEAWPVLAELIRDHTARGGTVVSSEHDPVVLRASERRVRLAAGAIVVPDASGGVSRIVASRDGTRHAFDVADDERDDTLRGLLDDGWSVLEVHRGSGE